MASITFDGTDLSGADYKLIVTNSDVEPQLSKPRVQFEEFALNDGGVSWGVSKGMATFNLTCKVAGASPSERDTLVSNIKNVLSVTTEGEKQLILSWRPSEYWNVRLVSEFRPEMAITGALFDLKFIAPDPNPKSVN